MYFRSVKVVIAGYNFEISYRAFWVILSTQKIWGLELIKSEFLYFIKIKKKLRLKKSYYISSVNKDFILYKAYL